MKISCDKFSGTSPPRANGCDDIEVLFEVPWSSSLVLIDVISGNLLLYFIDLLARKHELYIL